MKYPLWSIAIFAFLISSCAPSVSAPTSTSLPSATVAPSATATETPLPTLTSTVAPSPTPTLSTDLNTYQFADNVSQVDRDFIQNGIQIARYFLLNNFGSDFARGVKIVVLNDPSEKTAKEAGGAGAFTVPTNGDPYIHLNVGSEVFKAERPKSQGRAIALIVHELTHYWQYEHGCVQINYPPYQPTTFMIEGQAGYVGYIAAGAVNPEEFKYDLSDEYALGYWQVDTWKENDWFNEHAVSAVIVRHLFDQHGTMAFTQFCDSIGRGTKPNDAFQSSFGISVQDFRAQIKQEILGVLADCTVATCGAGVDNYSDIYKLKHMLNPLATGPNLVVNFVDQNDQLVNLTHVSMLRQAENSDGTRGYAQPFMVSGTFSQAMKPGRYSFWFCEPGYPTNENDGACIEHETDWIDVFSDKVTNITFKIPLAIELQKSAEPNFILTIKDKDGNPLPNIGLQVCNYDTPVIICTPSNPGNYTDSTGVFKGSFRSGKYLVRINTENEFKDIDISDNNITTYTYQLPNPNLIVKFTDVNGSLVPEHWFVICKITDGKGICQNSTSLSLGWSGTNKQGVFEAQLEPGEYYILTCKMSDCPGHPYDYRIDNIIVKSEAEVTTVVYQLYK